VDTLDVAQDAEAQPVLGRDALDHNATAEPAPAACGRRPGSA
jgi:hypothetical protein